MGRVARRKFISISSDYWECSHNVEYIIKETNA